MTDGAASTGRWLGYGGLLPFAGLLLVMATQPAHSPPAQTALLGMMVYGAVILSFVGAVHWGWAVARGDNAVRAGLCASVLPALVGWMAALLPTLLPAYLGFAILIAAFAGWYAYERFRGPWAAFPAWYRTLRTHLTVGVVLLLGLGLLVAA